MIAFWFVIVAKSYRLQLIVYLTRHITQTGLTRWMSTTYNISKPLDCKEQIAD